MVAPPMTAALLAILDALAMPRGRSGGAYPTEECGGLGLAVAGARRETPALDVVGGVGALAGDLFDRANLLGGVQRVLRCARHADGDRACGRGLLLDCRRHPKRTLTRR